MTAFNYTYTYPTASGVCSGLAIVASTKGNVLSWNVTDTDGSTISAEVWSATTNNRASATLLATIALNVPVATVNHIDYGLTTGTAYFYWVRVRNATQPGAFYPVSATAGVSGTPVALVTGDLAPSGVTPGTYSKVTVDTYGRVTAGASSGNVQVFLASGTWTKPSGITFVRVRCCQGGQAGSNGVSTTGAGSAGGAGGNVSEQSFSAADLPATVTVTCGAGGASNGATGAASSFGIYLSSNGAFQVTGQGVYTVRGGGGGSLNTSTQGGGGSNSIYGDAGGTGGALGTQSVAPGNGGNGIASSITGFGGSGGGGGGTSVWFSFNGGNGGVGGPGSGGGGGGGSGSGSNTVGSGGAGGNGFVVIWGW